ncbi:MAG: 16S rRNA processing protein RimM [Lachnospiraceae bacterium]|nr:16S rRNA processing protein RimM [Lachnospiraceae bacterium]
MEGMRRVGVITKTHGLKGGVKVYPTTDDPGRLSPGRVVWLDAKSGPISATIKSVSPFKKIFIITFEEFSDINEIEPFKGVDLLMENEPDALAEGEYYVDDLIGLSVQDEEGRELGTLSEVMVTGDNDVYIVKSNDAEILIPAIKDCILEVSPEEGRMKVHLLPGLV